MKKNFKQLFDYLLYLFVFLLPWQTKLILRLSKSNFQEIALYGSEIVLFILLILFFVGKRKEFGQTLKFKKEDGMLITLLLFVLFSLLFSEDVLLAVVHFLVLLLAVGLFYILREDIKDRAYNEEGVKRKNLIYVFLFSILLQSFIAVYQFVSQNIFAAKFLGIAKHSADVLGSAVIETSSGRWLRAYGGFDHPNILGGVLAISLIFNILLLSKKKVLRTSKQKASSFFLFLVYFVSLFALIFSFSRSAWLAFVIGFIILIIESIVKKEKWVTKRLLALFIFSFLAVLIIAVPYHSLIQTRVLGQGRLEQKSIQERKGGYLEAGSLIVKHPIFGVGFGNYTVVTKLEDNNRHLNWFYTPIHNAFVLLSAETGIVSTLIFVVFLFYLLFKNDRPEYYSRAIIISLIILLLLDHWLISLPFGLLFLFFVLGLI